MATKQKTMTNAHGDVVPLKYVPKYDRAKDAVVKRIQARFVKARKELEKLVVESLNDIDTLKVYQEDGAMGGVKGNVSLTSFDGMVMVQIQQNYCIRLDERVIKAKELMFEYAKRLAGKVEGNDGAALLEIIKGAFEANKAGALPYAKVLGLLKLNINAAEWVEAKTLLTESIKPEKGKRYLRCFVKPDRQHDGQMIRLDIADCWPVETAQG